MPSTLPLRLSSPDLVKSLASLGSLHLGFEQYPGDYFFEKIFEEMMRDKLLKGLAWFGCIQTPAWLGIGLPGIVLSVCGFLANAPWFDVMWLFISGCMLGMGVFIGWQNYKYRPSRQQFGTRVGIEFIPMTEAASRVYSEARACKAPLASAAEQMSGSGKDAYENILAWMSHNISEKIPVWGTKPSTMSVERIPKEELCHLVFAEGGNILKPIFGQSVSFRAIRVKTDDLNAVIDELHVKTE